MATEFGFLPSDDEYRGSGWSAEPLDDLPTKRDRVLNHACCSEKWFYPPIVECQTDPSSRRRPLTQADRFVLPCTHRLEIDRPGPLANKDVVVLLYALGFANGLLLVQNGWGHLYRAAIRPGLLSGFYTSPRAAAEIVDLTLQLPRRHDDGIEAGRNGLSGVLCWYLFGQSYTRRFEEFAAQYTVLDSLCHLYDKISGSTLFKKPHACRPEALCRLLGVEPPSWIQAQRDAKKRKWSSELSTLRNGLVHEGMFGNKPATLGLPGDDLLESISWLHELNRSLILAIIGFNHPSASDPEWKQPIWKEYVGFE